MSSFAWLGSDDTQAAPAFRNVCPRLDAASLGRCTVWIKNPVPASVLRVPAVH
jgi:hypothetical protein